MIIIQMSGGLGNQLFQYALYYKLKKMGKEVKIDDMTSYALDNARPVQLTVFDLDYPRATKEEITLMRDSSPALKDKIRRKLHGRNLKQYIEENYCYDEKIFDLEDTYLIGYYQSEKYFSDIRNEIRELYKFRTGVLTEHTLEYEKELTDIPDAVSIHVRRGDYLNSSSGDMYSDICTDEYYDAAIKHMLELYPQAVFYLFTNDQTWADFWINRHPQADIRVVKGNSEFTGYLDMYLMSRCKHHIIANSSFSWWGAWLSVDESGTTIAPKPWLNSEYCSDIHTRRMTLISPEGKIID